jgi:hypothetical protein
VPSGVDDRDGDELPEEDEEDAAAAVPMAADPSNAEKLIIFIEKHMATVEKVLAGGVSCKADEVGLVEVLIAAMEACGRAEESVDHDDQEPAVLDRLDPRIEVLLDRANALERSISLSLPGWSASSGAEAEPVLKKAAGKMKRKRQPGDSDADESDDQSLASMDSNTSDGSAVSSTTSTSSRRGKLTLSQRGYDPAPLKELPPPPARHPSSGHKNNYNPNKKFNRQEKYGIRRLLDRRGRHVNKGKHRLDGIAYLVQWETHHCQMSWVWKKDLRGLGWMTQQLDDWKTACASGEGPMVSATDWFKQRWTGATASATWRCFFEAIQAAVYSLGRTDLLRLPLWRAFERSYAKDVSRGVDKTDMNEFYRFMRNSGVPVNYVELMPNRLHVSATSAKLLKDEARKLPIGWYVVHAGDADDEHCFALHAHEDPSVINQLVEDEKPIVQPLLNLQWIKRTVSIRRVELMPDGWVFKPNKKKKKKKKKKQAS